MERDVHLGQIGRWRERHVPVLEPRRDDVLGGELLAQRLGELPARPRDEQAASQLHALSRTGALSRRGSHQSRLPAYQSAVARSPSSKEISGSQPSSCRSFEESSR